VLGRLLTWSRNAVTFKTSTNHVVTMNMDGSFPTAQIYYTGAGCTGTAYLNSGGTANSEIYGRVASWSGSLNSFVVPTTVGADGVSVSVAFTAATIDNPACGANAGARDGWLLQTVTRAAIGLPATITTPISF